MSDVESRLKSRLSEEEFQLALKIIALPPSRIRGFIEEKIEEALRQ
ncbi:MAG: hypothetical protein HYU39_06465 [Thaumarchaeota archaeon]|nr:hypothetical protein [Nitrososphaerota archaeon]